MLWDVLVLGLVTNRLKGTHMHGDPDELVEEHAFS